MYYRNRDYIAVVVVMMVCGIIEYVFGGSLLIRFSVPAFSIPACLTVASACGESGFRFPKKGEEGERAKEKE